MNYVPGDFPRSFMLNQFNMSYQRHQTVSSIVKDMAKEWKMAFYSLPF